MENANLDVPAPVDALELDEDPTPLSVTIDPKADSSVTATLRAGLHKSVEMCDSIPGLIAQRVLPPLTAACAAAHLTESLVKTKEALHSGKEADLRKGIAESVTGAIGLSHIPYGEAAKLVVTAGERATDKKADSKEVLQKTVQAAGRVVSEKIGGGLAGGALDMATDYAAGKIPEIDKKKEVAEIKEATPEVIEPEVISAAPEQQAEQQVSKPIARPAPQRSPGSHILGALKSAPKPQPKKIVAPTPYD